MKFGRKVACTLALTSAGCAAPGADPTYELDRYHLVPSASAGGSSARAASMARVPAPVALPAHDVPPGALEEEQ